MSFDVCVVGAGVIGSSIAYHAARGGARVCLVDPAAEVRAPAASWASAGGVRRQNRHPAEWPLTIEAAARWPRLDEELGEPTGFRAGGHLHVAETREELDAVAARAAEEARGGIEVEMLDAAAVLRLAPGLGAGVAGGAHTPGDGQADPRATTRAFRRAAIRHGAEERPAPVRELSVAGGRVIGVRLPEESIRAETVVLAGGAWSAALAAPWLRLPVVADALQMLETDPMPDELVPTITAEGRRLSLKQLPSGAYLVGGGWPGEVEGEECRVLPASAAGSWATATSLYGPLRSTRPARSWCGLEARTPDGLPLIGPSEELVGLFLCAAFCSHGFQLAPAVGRAVAAALREGTEAELAAYLPGRFRGGATEAGSPRRPAPSGS